ncbi:MAG: LamG-like jellyroll fold domain-containing protein [Pirellulaceae bacterium]
MAVEDDPPGAILRSIVEPSAHIDEQYRSEIFQLDDGTILSGLVKGEAKGQLLIASNPQQPEEVREIELEQIERRRKSDVSLMPLGLLNNMGEQDIADLLTYVEAGGNANYFAYRNASVPRESWSDPHLPVQSGLRLWLDAGRINDGRAAKGMTELIDGGSVGLWPDASGQGWNARQRQSESQPLFRSTINGNWVEFDGENDYLTATPARLKTLEFTAMLVVAPNHNRGWPGLISANALGRNDYQSGFNVDLMHESTASWQTIMSEGPGYPGVVNMMHENHPWGQFMIVTLRSQPGDEGVLLKINGRAQGTRQRPAEWIEIEELTVGARYWSNDPLVPPFNRGFLCGRVAHVLFYDRALGDEELVANEVYLWNSNQSLLDPTLNK